MEDDDIGWLDGIDEATLAELCDDGPYGPSRTTPCTGKSDQTDLRSDESKENTAPLRQQVEEIDLTDDTTDNFRYPTSDQSGIQASAVSQVPAAFTKLASVQSTLSVNRSWNTADHTNYGSSTTSKRLNSIGYSRPTAPSNLEKQDQDASNHNGLQQGTQSQELPFSPTHGARAAVKLAKTKRYNSNQLCGKGKVSKRLKSITNDEKVDISADEENQEPASQSRRVPVSELPQINEETKDTWIFPQSESYSEREYQRKIVETALGYNTLVSLPTGLGKTFIASVVMYNFYRWYPQGQVIFLAPTKPLVVQQVEACYKIMGLPEKVTAQLLGNIKPAERKALWHSQNVIFCTPQLMENDLRANRADPKKIVLIVVDEAHRAQGNYAYCNVVKLTDKIHQRYRMLALSATPGTDISRVSEVFNNLHITKIEVRSDFDSDVQPYTHLKTIERVNVPLSKELEQLTDEFCAMVKPIVQRMNKSGWLRFHDPKRLNVMLLMEACNDFKSKSQEHGLPQDEISQVMSDFNALLSLIPALKELQTHGTWSFHKALLNYAQNPQMNRTKQWLFKQNSWRRLMQRLTKMEESGRHLVHPKLLKLSEVLRDHFTRKIKGGTSSRAIVFTQTRSSVDEVIKHLEWKDSDLMKTAAFVGQGSSKATNSTGAAARGQKQTEQVDTIAKFRKGECNVLVATCIGEEGLDIGEVGIIVMFDAVGSPIRTIQRLGRTGRSGVGECVALVTPGTEARKFDGAFRDYRKISSFLRNCSDKLPSYEPPEEYHGLVGEPEMVRESISVSEFRSSQVAGATRKRRQNKAEKSEKPKRKKKNSSSEEKSVKTADMSTFTKPKVPNTAKKPSKDDISDEATVSISSIKKKQACPQPTADLAEESETSTGLSQDDVLAMWAEESQNTFDLAKQAIATSDVHTDDTHDKDVDIEKDIGAADSEASESQSPVPQTKKRGRLKRLRKRAVDKYVERDAEEDRDEDGVAWTSDEEDDDDSVSNNYDRMDPFIDDETDWDENDMETQDEQSEKKTKINRHEIRQRSVLSQADNRTLVSSALRCKQSSSLPTINRVMQEIDESTRQNNNITSQSSLSTSGEVGDLQDGTDEEVEREARFGEESDDSDAHSFVVNDMGEEGESYMFSNNGSHLECSLTPDEPCCLGCNALVRNNRSYQCRQCSEIYLCEACLRYKNVLHSEEGHSFQFVTKNYERPPEQFRKVQERKTAASNHLLTAEKPYDAECDECSASDTKDLNKSDIQETKHNGHFMNENTAMTHSVSMGRDSKTPVHTAEATTINKQDNGDDEVKERIRRNKEAALRRLQARKQGSIADTATELSGIVTPAVTMQESSALTDRSSVPWDLVRNDFNILGDTCESDSSDEDEDSRGVENAQMRILIGQRKNNKADSFYSEFQDAANHSLGGKKCSLEIYELPLHANTVCLQDLSCFILLGDKDFRDLDQLHLEALRNELKLLNDRVRGILLYSQLAQETDQLQESYIQTTLQTNRKVWNYSSLMKALRTILDRASTVTSDVFVKIPWAPSFELKDGECKHFNTGDAHRDRNAKIAKGRLLMRKFQLSPEESIAVVAAIGKAKIQEAAQGLTVSALTKASGISESRASEVCRKVQS